MRHRREARVAVNELLRIFRQVDGVVTDALKFAEALNIIVEQIVAVAVWHVRRETDKVVVHMVGKLVDVVFVFIDDLDLMGVVLVEHAHCAHHARARKARHGGDGLARAGKGDGGRGKELSSAAKARARRSRQGAHRP